MNMFSCSFLFGNQRIDINDPVVLLNFLFLGGKAISEPYPAPGPDPTTDVLGCGRWPV